MELFLILKSVLFKLSTKETEINWFSWVSSFVGEEGDEKSKIWKAGWQAEKSSRSQCFSLVLKAVWRQNAFLFRGGREISIFYLVSISIYLMFLAILVFKTFLSHLVLGSYLFKTFLTILVNFIMHILIFNNTKIKVYYNNWNRKHYFIMILFYNGNISVSLWYLK